MHRRAERARVEDVDPLGTHGVRDTPVGSLVIKEDVQKPDLLFVGTEFGLWISPDGGNQWAQFKGGNFPNKWWFCFYFFKFE